MRDYCPSRQEQKKLKAKKIKAKKTRRSQKKSKNLSSYWHKIFLFLFSFSLVSLLFALLIYLLRVQQIKQHQLSNTQHILIKEAGRPHAWVVLSPAEQKVKIFDFDQLSRQNWESFNPSLDNPDSELSREEENLFFSLLFGAFIDQIVEYKNQDLVETQQKQFKEFLINELKGRGVKKLAFYLEQNQVSWEWFNGDQSLSCQAEQLQLQNFLDRNTSANYGKIFECPVAVVNSSTQPGLATVFARLLEKDGFSVVRRDGGCEVLPESVLFVDQETEACQLLMSRFKQLMPEKNIKYDRELTQRYRSSAVIFLADDLSKLRIAAFDFFHDDFQ
jgi:hypothetical protein